MSMTSETGGRKRGAVRAAEFDVAEARKAFFLMVGFIALIWVLQIFNWADHYRLDGGARGVRPTADALVEEGLLRRVSVEDGGLPVLVRADAELDGEVPGAGVLLSPFDNLLWDRAFVERVFGFRHVIEVYKRAPERVYGYYVLPLLLGDRLVGRADLKAERAEGVLHLRAFHVEPGVRQSKRLDTALEGALSRLARTLELERVAR